MPTELLSFDSTGPDRTADLARLLGTRLCTGDCLLLEGSIGAGKTHFARALIQSNQDAPEDVPSPTFTLVQTYETRLGEIWHCDLYRLTDPSELEELGLTGAFETAITLIEWPDRLGAMTPDQALHLRFALDPFEHGRRQISLWARGSVWATRLEGLVQ